MKAICIGTETRDSRGFETNYAFTVGQQYVIYGFGALNGKLIYVVQKFDELGYPSLAPIELFGPPSGSFPAGLVLDIVNLPYVKSAVLASPCFQGEYFYDRLTDGEPEERAIWAETKRRFEEACGYKNSSGDPIDPVDPEE